MISISIQNFIPQIQEALKEYDTDDKGDKLFHLLYTTEGTTVTGETELNLAIELAKIYNIPIYDVISGKVDLDVLRFLDMRFDIIEDVSTLPSLEDNKKIKTKKKSKAEQSKVIDFKERLGIKDEEKKNKED